MKRWSWIVPALAFLFAFGPGSAVYAQGMGGGMSGGHSGAGGMGGGGHDLADMGMEMGCPWPDCPDLAELIEECEEPDGHDLEEWMESMEHMDFMEDMMGEELCEFNDCPFGEGREGCDNSWIDECGS